MIPHPDYPLEYFRYAESCLSTGGFPTPPATVDELKAIVAEHPAAAHRYLPTQAIRNRMGLPDLGKPAKPWGSCQQEDFLATLVMDPQFAAAVCRGLGVRDEL